LFRVKSIFTKSGETREEQQTAPTTRTKKGKEKREKTRGIIIIKTDRLSLALFCRTEMETLFFLFFNWNDQKGKKEKEKTSFFGGTKSHLSPQKK
jgi:hypothetical protein